MTIHVGVKGRNGWLACVLPQPWNVWRTSPSCCPTHRHGPIEASNEKVEGSRQVEALKSSALFSLLSKNVPDERSGFVSSQAQRPTRTWRRLLRARTPRIASDFRAWPPVRQGHLAVAHLRVHLPRALPRRPGERADLPPIGGAIEFVLALLRQLSEAYPDDSAVRSATSSSPSPRSCTLPASTRSRAGLPRLSAASCLGVQRMRVARCC